MRFMIMICKSEKLYPKVRMYYERSEPVAEAFGDLDLKLMLV